MDSFIPPKGVATNELNCIPFYLLQQRIDIQNSNKIRGLWWPMCIVGILLEGNLPYFYLRYSTIVDFQIM